MTNHPNKVGREREDKRRTTQIHSLSYELEQVPFNFYSKRFFDVRNKN